MDIVKAARVSEKSLASDSIGNSSNDEIKQFLNSFVNVLISLKISKQKIFKVICRNRCFLENLLKSYSLDTTPALITHLVLLLNYLSKSSSSTILNSLRLHYANIEIIQALLAVVDASAIKMLMNNNNFASNCANEVINDRLKEIEHLKAKLKSFSLSKCTSINSSICTENFHEIKSYDSENNFEKSLQINKKQRPIKCRKNVASVLRTGAVMTKKMKFNDAIVEKIIAGGNNPFVLETNVKNSIKMAHEEEVNEIERRHLMGLISNEEAKIAKIDAIKRKQKAANELKREKRHLRNLMNEEFERSVSKSKVIIRKTHLNRLILKRKKFDVVFKKKIDADEVKKIHEKLQREIKAIKEKEMERKIKLIQKIRILEKRKNLKGKSSNECLQMSIDELRASMAKLQQQINHERENRQKRIHEEHNRHKQLIQNTETLIEIGRKLYRHRDQMKNEKVKRYSNVAVASTAPDLMKLREKLAQVRKIVSDSINT